MKNTKTTNLENCNLCYLMFSQVLREAQDDFENKKMAAIQNGHPGTTFKNLKIKE